MDVTAVLRIAFGKKSPTIRNILIFVTLTTLNNNCSKDYAKVGAIIAFGCN
jgi:hypothetical protein